MAVTQITTRQIKDGAVTGPKLGVATTKGDLFVHDGTSVVRLGLGAAVNGQVLTVDSTAAGGWSIQTPAASGLTHPQVMSRISIGA